MFEYSPQTSLNSLLAVGNVGQLVGKCIESLTNQAQNDLLVIKQCGCSNAFIQVCGHLLVGSRELPFIQVKIVVIKNT